MSWRETRPEKAPLSWAAVFGFAAWFCGTLALLIAATGAGIGPALLWAAAAFAFALGAMLETRP